MDAAVGPALLLYALGVTAIVVGVIGAVWLGRGR